MQKEKRNCLTDKLEKINSFWGENKLLPFFFGLTPKCDSKAITCTEANKGHMVVTKMRY